MKHNKKKKITVVGIGYVGTSLAVLLAQKHIVTLLDIDKEKVDKINNNISPIQDKKVSNFLKQKKLNLIATVSKSDAFREADFIVIATPTDYDEQTNFFNTSSITQVIEECLDYNTEASIVIKSTIPVGFTNHLISKYNKNEIFFSPEFLRENNALYDNLYPSRIVVGSKIKAAKIFAEILYECSLKPSTEILFTEPMEAESIKLFSNSYLAMRIAFFNELDSYALHHNLNVEDIIHGVSLDERIGNYYNNPSFGYGGYCLPKDSKQLLANYTDIPQNIIKAIVESNFTRKKFITNQILLKKPKLIGVYRLTMKSNSDNFRFSSVFEILEMLSLQGIKLIIYEPLLKEDNFNGIKIEKDISFFKQNSDLILANRLDKNLDDVLKKVYTRDIFKKD